MIHVSRSWRCYLCHWLWVWRKLPDGFSLAGSVLVCGAGILSLRLNPARAAMETTPGPATL